jgi:hypothetical protein
MNQPHFIDAWHTFFEAEFETLEDFNVLYKNPEFRRKMMVLGVYWGGLGVLVKEELVPIHLIAKFITNMTRTYWEKQTKVIYEWRKEVPRALSEAEHLYNELMKYIKEHPEYAT